MKITEFFKKSKSLVLFNRFRIHRKEEAFNHMVIDGYKNADFLELHTYGREYEGMTVYYANEKGCGMGFFAELGVTLIKLYFADERGFVPYVHWGEKYLYYEPNGVNEEKNAFLYYFEPVSKVKSIENACHVVFSEDSHYTQVKGLYQAISYDVSEDYINAMARMLKKYIHYNKETREYLQKQFNELIGEKKTIAVHYRGTDFNKGYNNHPIPVRIEQEIEIVRELLQQKKYEQIFLATDENEVVELFIREFGNIVKVYEDTFRDNGSGESIAFSSSQRELHHYKLGLEVLRDQYTLTHCDGIVCGYSNITFIARVMRRAWFDHDWEDYCLIDNGLYHNQNSFGASKNARRKQ